MKILLVSPLPPPSGGMATWTKQYLKDNVNINEIYTVNTSFIGERAQHTGGKLRIFPEVKRFFKVVSNYWTILRTKQIDVIHINSSCSKTGILRDALCVVLAKKHHIVFHCHCNIQDQLTSKLTSIVGRYVFNSVDTVIVLNDESQSYVKKMANVRTELIPNSIDKNVIVSSHKVSDALTNIIYVGHVKSKKGIREIIEAAQRESDILFHLVGPVTDEISKISTPKNILFYGKKEHKEAISMMRKADAFLFPSYTEGFSMVMLEAMAAGLPIIATRVGSNAEMIETGGGIIIEPKSSDEIVNAIEKIRPRELRMKMSDWNLNKVSCAYRDDVVFKRIQEVYREICV